MRSFSVALVFTSLVIPALTPAQEWAFYGGDPGGTKYSRLEQIDRTNVNQLRPAWMFHTGDISDGSKWPTRSVFENTPLVANGVMYLTTPFSRLIALDPETGKELWSFDPRIDLTLSANLFINRGAAYWSDGSKRRVFLGTLDGRLFSLMADSGKLDDSFGHAGWLDLRAGAAEKYPNRRLGMSSPPAIYKNVVICGSIVSDSDPHGPAGIVRGFDARTGKLLWIFSPIPQAGEFGNDGWTGDSWNGRGGANAWAPLTVDTARGIVFLPLTSPSADMYGGDRPGAGLFGDSLVALNALTGKRLWHFQTLHHDLWDYDLPAQPTLVQAMKGGKIVDAVAQVTKTGYTFVFNRITGKPIFPIEEVPVPKSEIPGEVAYPTQPRPVMPPPFARQGMTAAELGNVTPETRAYCQSLMEGADLAPMYTPISFRRTILFPGTVGGANWGGASYDPETRTLYVNSMDVGMVLRLVKAAEGSTSPYRSRGAQSPYSRFWDPDLIPCQQPPWGFLTAINLDTGQFRWRSVLGVVDKLIERGLPPTGAPNIGGTLVTGGGLVFVGATNDSRFRAFDKDTGKELWATKLPASAHATPMTFRGKKSGKQFVVIAAGGGNKFSNVFSDTLVAFSLPSHPDASPQVSYSRSPTRERDIVQRNTTPAASAAPEIYGHARHASFKIECASCHAGSVNGERAGFPRQAQCMTCHGSNNGAPAVAWLTALPASKMLAPAAPIYQLPDFVFFRHDKHEVKGIGCTTCHGDVTAQARLQPVLAMKMKACVDCHQANRAAVSCTTCHTLTQ
jgi:quinoprotein glucose dehydrogenase